LVLEDVVLSAPANLAAGPQYTVKFRNQGTAAAGKFVVGVFAGFSAKLSDDAPRAVVEVNCLAAGESKAVTLRLPQKSLQMAGADGEQAAFTRLFVGVDVMNTVAETDETNNMAVIDRAALDAAQ
jgi:subtilase family serine protease